MLIPLKRNYLFTAIGVASFIILVQFIPDPLIESWINSAPRSCQGLFCSWAILVARNSFFLSHSHYIWEILICFNIFFIAFYIWAIIDIMLNHVQTPEWSAKNLKFGLPMLIVIDSLLRSLLSN